MLDPPVLRLAKRAWAVVLLAAFVALAMLLSAIGLPEGYSAVGGWVALLDTAMRSGGLSGLYVLSSLGYAGVVLTGVGWLAGGGRRAPVGRVGDVVAGSAEDRGRVFGGGWGVLALGLAIGPFMSHALGWAGLLSGKQGQWVAWGTVVVGLVLLLVLTLRAVRGRPNLVLWPRGAILFVPGLALLLVASATPPGWLWASEARGYDALAYHVPLAQEWAAGPRLEPVAHNVFSFLPSYFNAVFTHFAAMCGQGAAAGSGGGGVTGGGVTGGGATGLVAGAGFGLMACSFVHGHYAVGSALLIGRVVVVLLRRGVVGGMGGSGEGVGATDRADVAAEAGAIAGACAVSVPWVLVVSSLPYNESAVAAMFAGALWWGVGDVGGVRSEGGEGGGDGGSWVIRGGLAAFLLGVAVGCKPTAAFLAGPTVGLWLLAFAPVRRWAPMAAVGVVLGLAAVSPFLVRNYVVSGNPVFPAGAGVFGTAHWTPEQVTRFADSVRLDASVATRLDLLLGLSDPTNTSLPAVFDPNSRARVSEPRGVFHTQWSLFFPAVAVGAVVAMTRRGLVKATLVLVTGMLAAVVWWLLMSHAQSRFLLPLVVPGSVLIGLAAGRLAWAAGVAGGVEGASGGPGPAAKLSLFVAAVVPLVMAVSAFQVFIRQGPVFDAGGRFVGYMPNRHLPVGCALMTGELFRAELSRFTRRDEREAALANLDATAFVNLALPAGEPVLLVGDATPLYFSRPVVYHSAYDRSPLGELVAAFPGQPETWTARLVEGQGVATGLGRGGSSAGALRVKRPPVRYVLVNLSELQRLTGSRYSDPVVTPVLVRDWLSRTGTLIRSWPNGQSLFELRRPGANPPSLERSV